MFSKVILSKAPSHDNLPPAHFLGPHSSISGHTQSYVSPHNSNLIPTSTPATAARTHENRPPKVTSQVTSLGFMEEAIARFVAAANALSRSTNADVSEAIAAIELIQSQSESYDLFMSVLASPTCAPNVKWFALNSLQIQIHQDIGVNLARLKGEALPAFLGILAQGHAIGDLLGKKLVSVVATISVITAEWPALPEGFPPDWCVELLSDVMSEMRMTYANAFVGPDLRDAMLGETVGQTLEFLAKWELGSDVCAVKEWMGLLETLLQNLMEFGLFVRSEVCVKMQNVARGVMAAIAQPVEENSPPYQMIMQFVSVLRVILSECLPMRMEPEELDIVVNMVLPCVKSLAEWMCRRGEMDSVLELLDSLTAMKPDGSDDEGSARFLAMVQDTMEWVMKLCSELFKAGDGKTRITVLDYLSRVFEVVVMYPDRQKVDGYLKWFLYFIVEAAESSWLYVFGNILHSALRANPGLVAECLGSIISQPCFPEAGMYSILCAVKGFHPDVLKACLERICKTDPTKVPISGIRLAWVFRETLPLDNLANIIFAAIDRTAPEREDIPGSPFYYAAKYLRLLIKQNPTFLGSIPHGVLAKIQAQIMQPVLKNAKSAFKFMKSVWCVLHERRDASASEVLGHLVASITQRTDAVTIGFRQGDPETAKSVQILGAFVRACAGMPEAFFGVVYSTVLERTGPVFNSSEFVQSFGPDGEDLLSILASSLIAGGAAKQNMQIFEAWVLKSIAVCPVPGHFQVLDSLVLANQFTFVPELTEFYRTYRFAEDDQLTVAVLKHLYLLLERGDSIYEHVPACFFAECLMAQTQVHGDAVRLIRSAGMPRDPHYARVLLKGIMGQLFCGSSDRLDDAIRILVDFTTEQSVPELGELYKDIVANIPNSEHLVKTIADLVGYVSQDDPQYVELESQYYSKILIWRQHFPIQRLREYFGS